MSCRRRLTRPTALLGAVAVVMGVGGAASALGGPNVNVSRSQTVTLPAIQGGVKVCLGTSCPVKTPPLSEGAKLTVEAQSSDTATLPELQVEPEATCPDGSGDPAATIFVKTAEAHAIVSAKVTGTNALSGASQAPEPITADVEPLSTETFAACFQPVSVEE